MYMYIYCSVFITSCFYSLYLNGEYDESKHQNGCAFACERTIVSCNVFGYMIYMYVNSDGYCLLFD